MSISYEVDEERGLVVTVFSGNVTSDDLIAHARAFTADARVARHYSHLVDLSMVELITISANAVGAASRILAKVECLKNGRTAIVAPRDISFALSRMYQMHSEGWKPTIEVFRDMGGAKKWLEDAPAIPPLQITPHDPILPRVHEAPSRGGRKSGGTRK